MYVYSFLEELQADLKPQQKTCLVDISQYESLPHAVRLLDMIIRENMSQLYLVIYLPENSVFFEEAVKVLEKYIDIAPYLSMMLYTEKYQNHSRSILLSHIDAVFLTKKLKGVEYIELFRLDAFVFCLSDDLYDDSQFVFDLSQVETNVFKTWFYQDLPSLQNSVTKRDVKRLNQIHQVVALPDYEAYSKLTASINLVGLYYWGRSGTFFFHSLMDSHPEIMSTPLTILSGFFFFWNSQIQVFPEHKLVHMNHVKTMVESFVQNHFVLFDSSKPIRGIDSGLDTLGINNDQYIQVNADEFVHHLLQLCQQWLARHPSVERRTFWVFIHLAYELAQGKHENLLHKKYILFHHHIDKPRIDLQDIKNDFPNYRAIGLFRSPIRSFYSILNHQVKCSQNGVKRLYIPSEPDPNYTIFDTFNDGGYLYWYQHIVLGWTNIQKRYDIPFYEVQLEDLHLRPKSVLKNLCQILGIKWSQSILSSTFNGLSYGFKNMYENQRIEGFSVKRSQSHEWKCCFSEGDKRHIEAMINLSKSDPESPVLTQRVKNPLIQSALIPTKLERSAMKKAKSAGDVCFAEVVSQNYTDRIRFILRHISGERCDFDWVDYRALAQALPQR